jgi:hypothetical protein
VEDPATVDLRFVFVGTDDVNLTADQAPELMQPAVDELTSIWDGAGITVGDIEYADFDGDVTTYETINGDQELGSLLREARDDRSITFFFVQSITSDDGATILGLAGGPPGAAANGGTSKSGVVVTTADFVGDGGEGDIQMAHVMAHEGLHFLGLFHTTEKAADGHDPLADTPECDASADADGNGQVNTDECAGADADNIMFWTGVGTAVSADQSWVVQRSSAAH